MKDQTEKQEVNVATISIIDGKDKFSIQAEEKEFNFSLYADEYKKIQFYFFKNIESMNNGLRFNPSNDVVIEKSYFINLLKRPGKNSVDIKNKVVKIQDINNIINSLSMSMNIMNIETKTFLNVLKLLPTMINFKNRKDVDEDLAGYQLLLYPSKINTNKYTPYSDSSTVLAKYYQRHSDSVYTSITNQKEELKSNYFMKFNDEIISFNVRQKPSFMNEVLRNIHLRNITTLPDISRSMGNCSCKIVTTSYIKFVSMVLDALIQAEALKIIEIKKTSKNVIEDTASLNKIIKFIAEEINEITKTSNDNSDYEQAIYDKPSDIYKLEPYKDCGNLNGSCMRPSSGSSCKAGSIVYDGISKILARVLKSNKYKDANGSLYEVFNNQNREPQTGTLIARAILWDNVTLLKDVSTIEKTQLLDRVYSSASVNNEFVKYAYENNILTKLSQNSGQYYITDGKKEFRSYCKELSISELRGMLKAHEKTNYLPYFDTFNEMTCLEYKLPSGEDRFRIFLHPGFDNRMLILTKIISLEEDNQKPSYTNDINFGIQGTGSNRISNFLMIIKNHNEWEKRQLNQKSENV